MGAGASSGFNYGTSHIDKYSQVKLRQAHGGNLPDELPPGTTVVEKEDADETRFLFANKNVVGDSKVLEYISTAVETLLTGPGLSKSGAKVIKKVAKAAVKIVTKSKLKRKGYIPLKEIDEPTRVVTQPFKSSTKAYRRRLPIAPKKIKETFVRPVEPDLIDFETPAQEGPSRSAEYKDDNLFSDESDYETPLDAETSFSSPQSRPTVEQEGVAHPVEETTGETGEVRDGTSDSWERQDNDEQRGDDGDGTDSEQPDKLSEFERRMEANGREFNRRWEQRRDRLLEGVADGAINLGIRAFNKFKNRTPARPKQSTRPKANAVEEPKSAQSGWITRPGKRIRRHYRTLGK